MSQKKLDEVNNRMIFILCGRKPYLWGESIGWNRGTVDSVFRLGKSPGPRDLALLARFERINLCWLLNGEGPPYLVLPPPDPRALATDPAIDYYLIDRPDGVHPPLIGVRKSPETAEAPGLLPVITVYNGSPGELMRAVEWLLWKEKTIHLAPDDDDHAAKLRAGLAGNRVLIDEGRGLLEKPTTLLPYPKMILSALVEERRNGTRLGSRSVLAADEQDWVMLYRALTEDRRAALLLIARGLAGDPS